MIFTIGICAIQDLDQEISQLKIQIQTLTETVQKQQQTIATILQKLNIT